jgi:hypothetical protein
MNVPILPLSTLTGIVASLAGVDASAFETQQPTIYASEPWGPDSKAAVEWSPFKGGLPDIACEHGLVRLLEVEPAQKFLNQSASDAASSLSPEILAGHLVTHVLELVAAGNPHA